MAQILVVLGSYWLAAALWCEYGGEPRYVWMALLPSVWLGTVLALHVWPDDGSSSG